MASPSLAMTCVISCAEASEGASQVRILEVRAKMPIVFRHACSLDRNWHS